MHYLKYKNVRPEYINAFFLSVVNWDKVNSGNISQKLNQTIRGSSTFSVEKDTTENLVITS